MPEVVYSSESPGKGWLSDGTGKWVRTSAAREDDSIHVAVIGGGPGGLFTSFILGKRRPDVRVTLFESSDRLGGKIHTDRFSDGTPFEAGVAELYEYKGPGEKDPLRQMIEEDLGLTTINMAGGGVVLRGECLRTHEDVEPIFGKETSEAIKIFHKKMVELMPLEKYAHRWQPDNAHPWADCTFYECIRKEIGHDMVAVEYVEAAVHSDLATESHTCNGLNGIKNVLLDNDDYIQLYHVKGGIGLVVEKLEEKIEADVDVRTEHRITAIRKAPGKETYLVTCQEDGQEYEEEFDAVIVCVPNHWLSQIRWGDPLLSEAIHRVTAHYDLPAHYLRVSMLFTEPWWNRYGLPGDFWMMDCLNGCCCYNEDFRWRSDRGHVLSFLLAGQDALLTCSSNQDDECIVQMVLDRLPDAWRDQAEQTLQEAQVDRYVGSVNAQPGGWPVEELIGEHQPEQQQHPGIYLVGDYFFDSTLNAALISSSTAVDLLLRHLGLEPKESSEWVEKLVPEGAQLSR